MVGERLSAVRYATSILSSAAFLLLSQTAFGHCLRNESFLDVLPIRVPLGIGATAPKGEERLLRTGTFAFLADISDFRKIDKGREIYVPPGTRYFLYQNGKLERGAYNLALLESSVCVYLARNDISIPTNSTTVERLKNDRRYAGATKLLFTWYRDYGNFDCGGEMLGIGPGEIFVITEDKISFAPGTERKGTILQKGCTIPLTETQREGAISHKLATPVDLQRVINWDDIGEFRSARFENLVGTFKTCPGKFEESRDVEVSVDTGARLGFSAGAATLNLGAAGNYKNRARRSLDLESDVRFKEQILAGPDGDAFYAITQNKCNQPIEFMRYDNPKWGKDVSFSKDLIKDALREMLKKKMIAEPLAQTIGFNETLGYPFVSCPEQYFALLAVSDFLGAQADYGPFLIAQMAVRQGPLRGGGKSCQGI